MFPNSHYTNMCAVGHYCIVTDFMGEKVDVYILKLCRQDLLDYEVDSDEEWEEEEPGESLSHSEGVRHLYFNF